MRGYLTRRLRWYSQMEALNVIIVPGSALVIVLCLGGKFNFALALSLAACALILAIGALYWWAVVQRLENAKSAFDRWLPRLAKVRLPSFAIILTSMVVSGVGIIHDVSPENIGAGIMSSIAGLEYLNYFVVQLQHFDHRADFNRLLRGKGFQRSHLRIDIAAWKRSTFPRDASFEQVTGKTPSRTTEPGAPS